MGAQRRPIDVGTLTTNEIVQKSLTDFTREDLYIALPATVVGVEDYESMQCVDVRGVINDVYEDGALVQSVLIKKVFVKLPAGGGFKIKLPIAVGDLVTLHWAHRNLNTFLDNSGIAVDEPIEMVADIRDCWVEHGFGTRSNNQSPSKTDLIVEGDNTVITVTPQGAVTVVTKGNISATTEGDVNLTCNKALVTSPESEFTGNVKIGGTLEVVGNSMKVGGAEVAGHTHNNNVPPLA